MTPDAWHLLLVVVITYAPLIYGAVFCRSEAPMERLIAGTEALTKMALAFIKMLRR
jgi:hypothetical protein